MIFQEGRSLFTIAEASKACGLSRTSLIRLEKSGFLTPYRIDPASGYRYYDANNIVEIGRYKRMQSVGLTKSEITAFYHDRIDYNGFMEDQHRKLYVIQQFVDELELRHGQKKYINSILTLPNLTCICSDISSSTFEGLGLIAYKHYENIIAEGFRVIPEQPPIIISDDWALLSTDSPSGCTFTVCVPIIPDPKHKHNDRIRVFPSGPALSVRGFGGYPVITDVVSNLYREASERGLEASGPVGLIILATSNDRGNVAEGTGFILECIMPVR